MTTCETCAGRRVVPVEEGYGARPCPDCRRLVEAATEITRRIEPVLVIWEVLPEVGRVKLVADWLEEVGLLRQPPSVPEGARWR